jgi:hypothetical protein
MQKTIMEATNPTTLETFMIPYIIGAAVSLVTCLIIGACCRKGGAAEDDPPRRTPATPFPPIDREPKP